MSQSSDPPDQQDPGAPSGGRKHGAAVARADLCDAVYRKVGLSRAESARLVELVFREITECLERGETVKLSSFGSFIVRNKRARLGRNPKTGVAAPIPAQRVMVFRASDIVKRRLIDGGAND
jgi:integration host factor subunit alpha